MLNRPRSLGALLALAALGLAACNDNTDPSTDPLTAQNAQLVGAATASTADLAVSALTSSVPEFGLGFPMFFTRARTLGAGPSFSAGDSMSNCPLASSLTDSDHDGVPDSATWTFTAFNCTQTDIEGNSRVLTGSVTLSDPGLTAGYDLGLNGLVMAYYQNGAASPAFRLAMDGHWGLRGTSDALALGQNYDVALTLGDEQVQLVNDLDVAFAAASGTAISAGLPLPDGTIVIEGGWNLSSSTGDHSLTLGTLTPLSYDDSCGGIVGGELEARGTGGTVHVTWTSCGAHTSTFTPE